MVSESLALSNLRLVVLFLVYLLSPGVKSTEFLDVNCTGLPFESALQANVAQGLLNRNSSLLVWLSGVGEGLGSAGQKVPTTIPNNNYF